MPLLTWTLDPWRRLLSGSLDRAMVGHHFRWASHQRDPPAGQARNLPVSLGCERLSMPGNQTRRRESMDDLAERLDKKLREWSPETAEQVRSRVVEIIELADQGLLDIVRSRRVEQEVLDLLDEPTTR
jgi:hypothetical protein